MSADYSPVGAYHTARQIPKGDAPERTLSAEILDYNNDAQTVYGEPCEVAVVKIESSSNCGVEATQHVRVFNVAPKFKRHPHETPGWVREVFSSLCDERGVLTDGARNHPISLTTREELTWDDILTDLLERADDLL